MGCGVGVAEFVYFVRYKNMEPLINFTLYVPWGLAVPIAILALVYAIKSII